MSTTDKPPLRAAAVLVAGMALSTLACGDGAMEPSATPTPSVVWVTPATVELSALGDTAQLSADVRDQQGQSMAGAAVTWTSEAPEVATVDSQGLVTAVGNGSAAITASAGSASGSATTWVAQEVRDVSVSVPGPVLVGDTVRLVAEAKDANGHAVAGSEFSWSSSDTTVATVDASGLVTGLASGEAEVTATSSGVAGGAEVAVRSAGSVSVSPSKEAIQLGDTLRLVAEAADENGQPLAAVRFSWSSNRPEVATVDQSGLVTGVAVGSATITATGAGATGTADIAVTNPDRAALVALYEATDGPNWVDNTNWLTDASLGEWYGVDTNAAGRVVRISLSGLYDNETRRFNRHGLRGQLPVELVNLAALETLNLSENDLSGPIPPGLGGLSSLERMDLSGNDLSGAVPPELGGLSKLELLHLSENDLSGAIPRALGGLANLRWLYLSGNGLSGAIPPELGGLSSLESLNLSSNGLSGAIPPALGGLSNLRWLYLSGNGLSGAIPPELRRLSSLESLNLSSNGLSGGIPGELGDLANLKRLDLGRNQLTGTIPPELGGLVNLVALSVNGNDIRGTVPPSFMKLPVQSFNWACGPTRVCMPGTSEALGWLDSMAGWRGPFCNASDQAVLSNLFELTGGDQWAASDGWLGGPALEQWDGVRTDRLGRVTALDLSDNGLTGGLPGDIGGLERLAQLHIDGNALVGRLPLSLTNLYLDEFHYGGTELCAPADDAFQAWLGGIGSLDGAGTECTPLTDRDILKALYHATGGPNWVNGRNWLSGAQIRHWHGVEVDGQDRVVGLNLAYNGLSGLIPKELGSLSNLQVLTLGGNRLTGGIPPELGELSNLRVLDTRWNDLSGLIPRELEGLSNLEQLVLGGNELSGAIPPELGGLSNLVYLALHNNDLSGAIPPELGGLSSLESLNLSWNGLSGAIPLELGGLSNLRYLSMGWNDFSGAIPRELGNLSNLVRLSLDENDLSGAIPWELGGLSNLQNLRLGGNELTGGIPRGLGGLSNLRQLSMSWNRLTGHVPPEFGGLAALTELELAHNRELAGAIPAGLKDLRLESLQAAGTDLCVPVDPGFSAWLANISDRRIALCGNGLVAYLVQTVQSRAHPVPLVAGEDALLRVFVTAARETTEGMPTVRARFYLGGFERHVADIPATSNPIPTKLDEGDLSKSANAEIPGRIVRPGLEMVVEIDPDDTLDPALGVPKRIPEAGRMTVEVSELPVLQLTAIPFLWSADPDRAAVEAAKGMEADPEGHDLLEDTRVLLPVGGIEVTAHGPVQSTSNNAYDLLSQTEAIRVLEGGGGHYVGLMSGTVTGVAGVAYIRSRSSFSRPNSGTIAHELGHNMGLAHAPCGVAGDPSYPYADGSTGSWGYDSGSGRLVPPSLHKDLMSYCGPQWISDYHFTKALRHRLRDEGKSPVAATRSLLLWGGIDAEGNPFLNPAFVAKAPAALPDATGDYTVTGRDTGGRELFSLSFPVLETADEEGSASFAFALPVRPGWGGSLATITFSGPAGSVVLDRESDIPMAILRDPWTGRVRGILRDPPLESEVAADAAGAAPSSLEVLFSRGIPEAGSWMR